MCLDVVSVLREVMLETGTTQSMLSRISGVRQPSISQFLSGKVELERRPARPAAVVHGLPPGGRPAPGRPELTRSERRSWMLHRRLSIHLTADTLE